MDTVLESNAQYSIKGRRTAMDEQSSWQAFACTGNILRYLDYKQQAVLPEESPAGDTDDRHLCDTGPCSERDPV